MSSDGKRFIARSRDNTLKLWDANSGHCLDTRDHEDKEFKQLLNVWSKQPTNRAIAHEGGIHILDPETRESLWSQYELPDGGILRIDEKLQRPIRGFIPDSAWRYLRWRTEDGKLHHAEVFGPLESIAVPMPEMP
jgi:hypothetical protein